MALYKRMVQNWLIDWANYDTSRRNLYFEINEGEDAEGMDYSLPEVVESRFRGASKEAKQVAYIMFAAPQEVMELLNKGVRDQMGFFRKVAKKLGFSDDQRDKVFVEIKHLLT